MGYITGRAHGLAVIWLLLAFACGALVVAPMAVAQDGGAGDGGAGDGGGDANFTVIDLSFLGTIAGQQPRTVYIHPKHYSSSVIVEAVNLANNGNDIIFVGSRNRTFDKFLLDLGRVNPHLASQLLNRLRKSRPGNRAAQRAAFQQVRKRLRQATELARKIGEKTGDLAPAVKLWRLYNRASDIVEKLTPKKQ